MEIHSTNLREMPIRLPKHLTNLRIMNNSLVIYVRNRDNNHNDVSHEDVRNINILSNFHQLDLPIN